MKCEVHLHIILNLQIVDLIHLWKWSGFCFEWRWCKRNVFSLTGGLAAVIYTDTLQAFVMVAGAACLMIISECQIFGNVPHFWKEILSFRIILSDRVRGKLNILVSNVMYIIWFFFKNWFIFIIHFHLLGFVKVGGYRELYYKYQHAIPNTTLHNPNTTCGLPREDSWVMLRDPINSDMPWPAFLLGQTPASIWYWCADQVCVLASSCCEAFVVIQ